LAEPWVCVGFEGGFGPKGLENIAQEPVGLWSRFRPEGPWELSPGFSLGAVIFTR
jgi:thioesterase domain-containing protein